jgi:hypothetical protein
VPGLRHLVGASLEIMPILGHRTEIEAMNYVKLGQS